MSRLRVFTAADPAGPSWRPATTPRSPATWAASACASSSGRRPSRSARAIRRSKVMAAYRADIDKLVARERLPGVDVVSSSVRTTRQGRAARSSSTSTTTRRTRCASSSPARACSPCTWTTRSMRSCARPATWSGCPTAPRTGSTWGRSRSFIAIRFFTERRRLGRPLHRHRHRPALSRATNRARRDENDPHRHRRHHQSSISFVKDVLFPYARRAACPAFVAMRTATSRRSGAGWTRWRPKSAASAATR
jgi:hypothetical protein